MADLDLTEAIEAAAQWDCAARPACRYHSAVAKRRIEAAAPIIERQVKARERAEAVQNLRAVFGVTNRAATWLERNRPATTGEAGQ